MNWDFFERLSKHKHSSAHRAVGLVLAIRAKADDPVCDPSITGLCKYASVCRLTVMRAISRFESDGLLTVERKFGCRNRYHLTSSPQRRVTRSNQCVTETGNQSTTETGQTPSTRLPSRPDPSTTETQKVIKGKTFPKQGKADADVPDSEVPY